MKRHYLFILIFVVALLLISILSTKSVYEIWSIELDDTTHYITSAKEFSSISNSKIHNPHSFVYPWYLSFFLNISPSLMLLKIAAVLWLMLTALLIWYETKDIKSLTLFIFSPIVYYSSIWIAPMIASGFFLTLAYLRIKKFEHDKKLKNLIISSLAIGLSCIFWEGALVFSFLFLLVFFFNQPFKNVIYFFIFAIIGLLPRLILDYIYFNLPIYSLIRFFGAAGIVSLGKNPTNFSFFHPNLRLLLLLIIISPLLFKILKINFKEYKKDIIFIVLSFLFVILYGADTKYALAVFPVLILLLSKTLTDKDIKKHVLISIPIILILIFPYFGETKDLTVSEELKELKSEFNFDSIVSGDQLQSSIASDQILNSLYWNQDLNIIWAADYNLIKQNKSYANYYDYKVKPKLNKARILEVTAAMSIDVNQDIENVKYQITGINEKPIQDFKRIKCLKYLCINEKK